MHHCNAACEIWTTSNKLQNFKHAKYKPVMALHKELSIETRVVNWAPLFGSGRARTWFLKNCRALIRREAGAKPRFSVRDTIFAMAGIKQREHIHGLFFVYLSLSAKKLRMQRTG